MSTPDKPSDPRLEQAGASDESIQQIHSILLREKPEPSEGYSPMPLMLLGFISTMIFVCAIYFVHFRGDNFNPLVYDERYDSSMQQASSGEQELTPEKLIAQGKKLFTTCAACHQATGLGIPGVYPPLAGSEWVQGSDERVVRILLHGLSGEVEVEGKKFNGNMPAFGPGGGYNWDDKKIAAVLSYVRNEWGNKADVIMPDRVAEIKAASASQTKPFSAEELLKLP